jgi:hypothetical protein
MISFTIEFLNKNEKILSFFLLKRYFKEIKEGSHELANEKDLINNESCLKLEITKNNKIDDPILRLVDFYDKKDRTIMNEINENLFKIK